MVSLTGLEDRIVSLEQQADILPTKTDVSLYSQTLMSQWNVLDAFSSDQARTIEELISLYVLVKGFYVDTRAQFTGHTGEPEGHHPTSDHIQGVGISDLNEHEANTSAHHDHPTGFLQQSGFFAHTGSVISVEAHVEPYYYGILGTGAFTPKDGVNTIGISQRLFAHPPSSWTESDNGHLLTFGISGLYRISSTINLEKDGDTTAASFQLDSYINETLRPGYGVAVEVHGNLVRDSASSSQLVHMKSGDTLKFKYNSLPLAGFFATVPEHGMSVSVQRISYHLGSGVA